MIILGTHKGLLLTDCNGRVKQEFFPGVPVPYAMRDPRTNVMWAGLDHGHWGQKLHRSDDEGQTWSEVPAPTYPEGEEITPGKPATLSYIWCIVPGGNDEPQRLYIGTEPGGLFRSDDYGETFQLVEGLWQHPSRFEHWFGGGRDLPGLCSIVVDPRDSQHIYAGVSVGGVFETTDGGETWEARNKGSIACYMPDPHVEVGQDPHFMIASPSNPDVLWQQNHCGVFRSTDGAQSWEEISQKDASVYFGFAIATDAKDSNVAWVIPAISDEIRMAVNRALAVCRTDDGGKTWQQFRTGLPQENCYDLVFRHALDVRGDTLAFGTTTGNLYLSENRGESWRCLGNDYPPINSVRFVE